MGRIGCFLNGDDYGERAARRSRRGAVVGRGLSRHLGDHVARWPVQLLEAGLVGLLVLVLWHGFVRLRLAFGPGAIGFFAIIGYANLRFLFGVPSGRLPRLVAGTWL